MRDIKFKAKRVDNDELAYGYYVADPEGRHRIYCQPFPEATSNTYFFVRPETLCQFTGLKDSNGVEIYEGDMVNCGSKYNYYVKFINGSFVYFHHNGLKEDGEDYRWGLLSRPFEIDIFKDKVKIIGNIHD